MAATKHSLPDHPLPWTIWRGLNKWMIIDANNERVCILIGPYQEETGNLIIDSVNDRFPEYETLQACRDYAEARLSSELNDALALVIKKIADGKMGPLQEVTKVSHVTPD